MSKDKETIADIVAEIRRLNPEKFLSTPWYCDHCQTGCARMPTASRRRRSANAKAERRRRRYAERLARLLGAKQLVENLQQLATRRAYAFLAHSSLMGAAEVRAELEDALLKAGGAE